MKVGELKMLTFSMGVTRMEMERIEMSRSEGQLRAARQEEKSKTSEVVHGCTEKGCCESEGC